MSSVRSVALAVVALVSALALAACEAKRSAGGMPQDVQAALAGAEQVELVALNPSERDAPRMLQGQYGITGSTMLRGAEVEAVAAEVARATAADAPVPACFEPRHALAFVSNATRYLIVVSYECGDFEVYKRDEKIAGGAFTGTPALFNRYLDAAGVPRVEPPA